MLLFDECFDYVFERETKRNDPDFVSDDPNDRGGITKYGISLRFLKSLSYDDLKQVSIFEDVNENTIRNLTKSQAKELYRHQFWLKAPFSEIRNKNICSYIFDMACNMGISPAIKCTQRAIWSVMQKKLMLIDDGILGKDTLELINKCALFILPALRSERASYYRLTAEKHSDQQKNLPGWLSRAYGK